MNHFVARTVLLAPPLPVGQIALSLILIVCLLYGSIKCLTEVKSHLNAVDYSKRTATILYLGHR